MFEIHATVESSDVEIFKSDCHEIGCKPLLIELENKHSRYEQLMTSQSFRHSDWDSELDKIKSALIIKGYKIQRLKVEINPYAYSNIPIKYFETHFRIKTNKSQEENLEKLTSSLGFHKSKNIFKKIDEHFYYQMATYRTFDLDISNFEDVISNFKSNLTKNNFSFDKVEVEACIIDTNDTIDALWLKN